MAAHFSFMQSVMETPIKIVGKGGYCFLKITADVQVTMRQSWTICSTDQFPSLIGLPTQCLLPIIAESRCRADRHIGRMVDHSGTNQRGHWEKVWRRRIFKQYIYRLCKAFVDGRKNENTKRNFILFDRKAVLIWTHLNPVVTDLSVTTSSSSSSFFSATLLIMDGGGFNFA